MFILPKQIIRFALLLLVTIIISPQSDSIELEKELNKYVTDDFTLYAENDQYLNLFVTNIEKTKKKLDSLLGVTLDYKPDIYLVGHLPDFNRIIGGRMPDWGAAAAIGEKKLIVMKSPDSFNLNKSLRELIAHEYTHLIIDKKSFFYEPPRWFNEGMAMLMSTEWSWTNNLSMNNAALFGNFIPLSDIQMVNRFHESKANLAYSESYLAVKYLIDNYSNKSLRIFLDNFSRTGNLDSALYHAAGATEVEFEREFKDYLNKRYNFASLFMDTIFFWIGLAFVVIIGFFVRFRKRREYYKKWEDEEKLASTDFDYGDPDNPEEPDFDDDESWRR